MGSVGTYASFPDGFLLTQQHSQDECCSERKYPQVIICTYWAAILVGAVLLWPGSTSQV